MLCHVPHSFEICFYFCFLSPSLATSEVAAWLPWVLHNIIYSPTGKKLEQFHIIIRFVCVCFFLKSRFIISLVMHFSKKLRRYSVYLLPVSFICQQPYLNSDSDIYRYCFSVSPYLTPNSL